MDIFKKVTLDDVRVGLAERGCAIGAVDPAEYHRWKHELGVPCVSKSALVDFMRNSYAYRYKDLAGIREESAALSKGSLIDCLTLTPELFHDLYTAEKVDRRTKAGKARAEELAARGITPVDPEDLEAAGLASIHARKALDMLCAVPELSAGQYQTQIGMWVWLDNVGGVPLATPLCVTGMLDVCPSDPEVGLIDLKSTSVNVADADEVNRNMARYGYGVQAAMYCDLFAACTGEVRDFSFLFVSVEPPCQTRHVSIDDSLLEMYRQRYQQGLVAYAECVASGNWGSVELEPMAYNPPVWELRKGVEA